MIKNTFLVTICLILSSVLGFVAQIVFVSSFGASSEMDVYFTLLAVPSIITGISPIIFSSVLIPTFAKFKSNQLELNKFIDSIWKIILIFAILFSSIGFFISVINLDLLISETQANLRNIGIQVSLMIWIGSGFIILSAYLSAILNYNKQFFKVAWTSLLPASFMIIIVLLFHTELGVRSISLGFCIAFVLQFIIFLKASKVSLNFFSFNIKQIKYKKLLLKQSFLVSLSLLPFSLIAPIAFFLASQLETGSVSYLGYSQSFAGFLSISVSMGISIVSFPELADKFAEGKGKLSLYDFELKLKYVILIALFAAGAFISLKSPILNLIYERGQFDSESVTNLSSVLPWYLIAGVFSAGLNLLRTLFYSKGEFKSIAILGLIMPIIFFISAGFLKTNFSFVGIGIANAITFFILFLSCIYLLKNKESFFLTENFNFFILKVSLITLISACITKLFYNFISNIYSQIPSISVCLLLFSIVYYLSSKFIFKSEEVEAILNFIFRKIKS